MQNKLEPCPLWGEGRKLQTHDYGDYDEIENARAGGRYQISRSARVNLGNHYSVETAAKLTTWIIDQHLSGESIPMITTTVLKQVESKRLLVFSQQLDRFFSLAAFRSFRVGDKFKIAQSVYEPDDTTDRRQLLAWLECFDGSQLDAIVRLLELEDLITADGEFIELTPVGYRRLEALSNSHESKQAFIAMWFNPEMDEAHLAGFEKAIQAVGYKPFRIDKKEHNNKIDDEIIAEIRKSRFIVADFTCGTVKVEGHKSAIARGGVYFEAGYAMGLGIPVIWTCRKDLIDEVHFDTRQFAHVVWETPSDLARNLYNRIRASIGELPDAPGFSE